jgi:glycosyltransferase involved in cell wall biosynthesis
MVGITKLRFSELPTLPYQISEVNGTKVLRSFYLKWPKNELLNLRKWTDSTVRLFQKYLATFGQPDIILAHSSIWAGYAASKIYKGYDIPYIITEHRSRYTGLTAEARKFFRDAHQSILEEAFREAKMIIAVSDALHNSIRKYASAGQEILTIPNLVDTDYYMPPAKRQRDPFVILSIGRLEHEKGMDLVIQAFDRLAGEIPNAWLRIIGKGPLENRLKALASEIKASENISFLGRLTPRQLLAEIQQASMLAVASRFEAFGVVFIEAMSTGMPVVAARSGGPETFITEMTGKVVENDNISALHDGLKYIYDNYNSYDPETIRQYVIDHFSKQAVIGKYAELIREICRTDPGDLP